MICRLLGSLIALAPSIFIRLCIFTPLDAQHGIGSNAGACSPPEAGGRRKWWEEDGARD